MELYLLYHTSFINFDHSSTRRLPWRTTKIKECTYQPLTIIFWVAISASYRTAASAWAMAAIMALLPPSSSTFLWLVRVLKLASRQTVGGGAYLDNPFINTPSPIFKPKRKRNSTQQEKKRPPSTLFSGLTSAVPTRECALHTPSALWICPAVLAEIVQRYGQRRRVLRLLHSCNKQPQHLCRGGGEIA